MEPFQALRVTCKWDKSSKTQVEIQTEKVLILGFTARLNIPVAIYQDKEGLIQYDSLKASTGNYREYSRFRVKMEF